MPCHTEPPGQSGGRGRGEPWARAFLDSGSHGRTGEAELAGLRLANLGYKDVSSCLVPDPGLTGAGGIVAWNVRAGWRGWLGVWALDWFICI